MILEQTQQNVDLNFEALRSARLALGRGEPSAASVQVAELPFGDDAALDVALASCRVLPASDGGIDVIMGDRPFVILCSDCIWKPELHKILLQTIASALARTSGLPQSSSQDRKIRPSALVCFQRRSPQVEAHFERCLAEFFCSGELSREEVGLGEVLDLVHWPSQLDLKTNGGTLEKEFYMCRLTAPGIRKVAPNSELE